MYQKIKLLLLILAIAGLVFLNRNLELSLSSGKISGKKDTVVLDAGHGGGDPGKVGVGDILEKDINLEIAKLVEGKLKKKKITVVMTRESDEMLAGENQEATKMGDMKERVRLINETQPQLVVSIHQNSYQDSSVSGAQVFYYSRSPEGESAALLMQQALQGVKPENTRQAKANDSYYMLKKTEYPTIIVECGFLSNPQEAQELADKEYQEKMADAVAQGILWGLGKDDPQKEENKNPAL